MGAIGVKEKCANGSCGWCKHCIPDMGKPFVLTGLSNGATAKCRAFNLRNWDQGGGLQMHSGCFTSPSWHKFSYISAMLIEELPCKYQVSLPPRPQVDGLLFRQWNSVHCLNVNIFFEATFFGLLGINGTGVFATGHSLGKQCQSTMKSLWNISILPESWLLQAGILKKALWTGFQVIDRKALKKKKKALHLPNCVCLVRTTSYHWCLNKLFETTPVNGQVGLHMPGVGLILEC